MSRAEGACRNGRPYNDGVEALWSEPVARGLRARRTSPDTPAWLSADQVAALDALARFVEMAGAPALDAEDEEHLDALLDESVDRYQSEEGQKLRRELVAGWAALAPWMDDDSQDPDYSSFPERAAELLRAADKVWRYVNKKREAWQAIMKMASNASFASDEGQDALTDPRLPPEVLKNHYAMQAGNCAAMAVLHATSGAEDDLPQAWLLEALAERRLRGARAALRHLASLPGSDVPPEVVRSEDRFDWAALQERYFARHRHIQRLLDESAAAGQPVYPPFDEDDVWPDR